MTVLLKLRILNDLHCFDNSFKKRKEYFSGNRIFFCELRRVSLVASREEKKRLYILRGDVSYGKNIHASRRIFCRGAYRNRCSLRGVYGHLSRNVPSNHEDIINRPWKPPQAFCLFQHVRVEPFTEQLMHVQIVW